MTDLTITFARPWLLLLLIPAAALTVLTYFLRPKKFRNTRNRITSMVLHMLIMVFSIGILSGLKFEYRVPNVENEILLLVDVSDTAEESRGAREEFMQTVISESKYDNFKVGVVTFGFTQEYAVPLTFDTESIFERYQNAPLPDTSGTDIAAALRYASGLLEHRETAKIVLISDGKETDETATTVIRSISAQGTKVDTVYISSDYSTDNVQVVGVEFPTYHVNVNEECTIGVDVISKNGARSTVIELYDNGDFDSENGVRTVDISTGTQVVTFNKTFETEGLHEIRVKVTESGDKLEENNTYYSYLYLEVYDHVLIIDQGKNDGESDALSELLKQEGADYDTEELHLASAEHVPSTVDELLAYDQIILNNIANADLTPYGLDKLLYSYVYEYGGGLFTVGGNDADGNAHAYNRFDLKNSLFQQMMPVQAIDYTPPVGVVIVVDISGSMAGDKLDWAKNGANICLQALTERDYMGIVTLETSYHTELQLTSRMEETTIKETIDRLSVGGGTMYRPAITRAGQALVAEKRIDRRHVILITDGLPGDQPEEYLPEVRRYYRNNGITFSAIGIDMTEGSDSADVMKQIVTEGDGELFFASSEYDLLSAISNDLKAPAIKELSEEPFHPAVANELSQVVNDVKYGLVQDTNDSGDVIKETARALDTTLGGFYGVRARERAETILIGDYNVPIYAQWKFGEGMVGSFMCDLSGHWSADFLKDKNGQKLLFNIVSNLMPTSNIRPNPIRMELEEENYFNHLSVYTTLGEGESIVGKLIEYTEDGEVATSLNERNENGSGDLYVTAELNADNHYTRTTFVVKKSGTYKIVLDKVDKDGNILATAETYKSFSYSKEYEMLMDPEADPEALMAELAVKGNGAAVASDDPWSVFKDFVIGNDRVVDPTMWLAIAVAVLFLMDVAVRKFKFKWLHEIVREHREKNGGGKG